MSIILSLTGTPLNVSEYAIESFAPSHCLFANTTLKATVIIPTNKLHKIDP